MNATQPPSTPQRTPVPISPSLGSSTPLSSSRASKLTTVIGDGSFESIMKARAQKRKEKDEHCVAELRVAMNNMDRSLTQEIKRRVEGNKALENKAREEITAMEKRLQLVLENRVQSFQHSLSLLESKVQELNDRLEEEKMNIPQDIEKKGKELKEILLEIQNDFSVERRDRLAREGRLMKQLNDHHQYISERWQQETEERTRDATELKNRLEHHESNRANADQEFEALITSELKALKDSLQQETMERKVEDDEIVEALNRYTANLQKSLSMLD
mmetsp:Transcript_11621/g.21731  ORF Transcript_11621/g.21731 Transcript_11621/m.21731 type:complete len:274 (-) Transcript_11621:418-1239(-)